MVLMNENQSKKKRATTFKNNLMNLYLEYLKKLFTRYPKKRWATTKRLTKQSWPENINQKFDEHSQW